MTTLPPPDRPRAAKDGGRRAAEESKMYNCILAELAHRHSLQESARVVIVYRIAHPVGSPENPPAKTLAEIRQSFQGTGPCPW